MGFSIDAELTLTDDEDDPDYEPGNDSATEEYPGVKVSHHVTSGCLGGLHAPTSHMAHTQEHLRNASLPVLAIRALGGASLTGGSRWICGGAATRAQ